MSLIVYFGWKRMFLPFLLHSSHSFMPSESTKDLLYTRHFARYQEYRQINPVWIPELEWKCLHGAVEAQMRVSSVLP